MKFWRFGRYFFKKWIKISKNCQIEPQAAKAQEYQQLVEGLGDVPVAPKPSDSSSEEDSDFEGEYSRWDRDALEGEASRDFDEAPMDDVGRLTSLEQQMLGLGTIWFWI